LRLVVSNPAKRPEPPSPKPPEVPRIVRLLEKAREWRALLDRGEAASAAAIAERAGLCAVYVRNILFLLRLHPAILAAIESLPVGAGDQVNERWLRPITRLPQEQQLTVAAERLDLTVEREECG
jgi:hypothetical protein